MTVEKTEIPNGALYVPEDSQGNVPAPEWGKFLSIVDASRNAVPVSDVDQ